MIISILSLNLVGCQGQRENPEEYRDDAATLDSRLKEHSHQHGAKSSATPPPEEEELFSIKGNSLHLADVVIRLPEGATASPSEAPMRLLEIQVEDSVIAGFYFGPNAGSEQANIDRWKGQFSSTESLEESNLAQDQAYLLEAYGSLGAAMPGMGSTAMQTDMGMLAAILRTSKGPFFFKATGADSEIRGLKDSFVTMIESVSNE